MRSRHMRSVFCNPFYCILISAFCCYNALFSSSPPWRANFREVCFWGFTIGPTIASLYRPTRIVTLWPTRLFIWNWICMDRPFNKGNCSKLILLEGLWLVYVPPGLILNILHFTSVHVFYNKTTIISRHGIHRLMPHGFRVFSVRCELS